VDELGSKLEQAITAVVKDGMSAVLDCHVVGSGF
jgi:hypothetical protein